MKVISVKNGAYKKVRRFLRSGLTADYEHKRGIDLTADYALRIPNYELAFVESGKNFCPAFYKKRAVKVVAVPRFQVLPNEKREHKRLYSL